MYRIKGVTVSAKKTKHGKESDLYEPVRKYIEQTWVLESKIDPNTFVLEITAHRGGKKTGGKWTRPDLSLVAVNTFPFIPGKTIELITFEVKPADNFGIDGVFETASHSKPAHRSYLMIHTPNGKPDTEEFQRLASECERFDLGLIIFKNPNDCDTFETVQEARRRNPNPGDVNSFINTVISKESKDRILKMLH